MYYSFTHLIEPCFLSPIYLSSMDSFIHGRVLLFTYGLIHIFMYAFMCAFINPSIKLMGLFIYSSVNIFTKSFIHSFMHVYMH